ncbi:MAG: GerMN domain-containing protein [Heliobacteriaceae bacterium]|nr:GerMN domain-containing protein [Heliobacteriaceae bacterium]MDD4587427.1 GerMN domain-containing protein [Heliobacteriaceae bacterium]
MERERNWSAGIILLVAALVVAFGLGGCQAIDRFVSMKEDFKAKETGLAKSQPVTDESQAVHTGAASLTADEQAPVPEQVLTLYFADVKGQNLVPVKRTIAKTESVARTAVEELIKGPGANTAVLPTIPAGTRLVDIALKDGVCTVNLSKEVQINHQGGSAGETLTVYSLVNTLTQFPTVERVQLLVEGQKEESLVGHLDISQAMARKNSMNEPANQSKAGAVTAN